MFVYLLEVAGLSLGRRGLCSWCVLDSPPGFLLFRPSKTFTPRWISFPNNAFISCSRLLR